MEHEGGIVEVSNISKLNHRESSLTSPYSYSLTHTMARRQGVRHECNFNDDRYAAVYEK